MGISAHFSVSPLLSPLLVFFHSPFSLSLSIFLFFFSFLSSFLVIFPCFFSASMFLLPFFLAWFLSFVLWEEQLQNIKLEGSFININPFCFFLFPVLLCLSDPLFLSYLIIILTCAFVEHESFTFRKRQVINTNLGTIIIIVRGGKET